jgi:sugar phosphate isomerase/epimerase
MIHVSSSCVKNDFIKDSVQELKAHGIHKIELSGGTKLYPELQQDLLIAKQSGVDFLIHNYFPPPAEPFVLNLASVNAQTSQASLDHCKRAIDLSQLLGAKKYGIHAGFFLDISINEIGKKLTPDKLVNESEATELFCNGFTELKKFAGKDVQLYVENNVFSKANSESFNGVNPFMLTNAESFNELRKVLDFDLLLDVAHLKVSCQSLGLKFESELEQLFQQSDYIHLSDNDGFADTNRPIYSESELFSSLGKLQGWSGKTITLEVYDNMAEIKESLLNVTQLVHA